MQFQLKNKDFKEKKGHFLVFILREPSLSMIKIDNKKEA